MTAANESAEKDAQEQAAPMIDMPSLRLAIGRISAIAGLLDPALDLAPFDEEEGSEKYLDRMACNIDNSVADLIAERDALKRQLAAQKGQVTKARKEVEALAAELPGKPRPIAAPKDPWEAADLIEAIGDAEDVHLLFSDGKRELAGVAPMAIAVSAWRKSGDRVVLTAKDLQIVGNGPGVQVLRAYALMLDGEIVAVRDRHEPLNVRPNQRYQLAGDVIF